MNINEKITFDMSPLMMKFFQIDAHLIALNRVLLTDEQKGKFQELYLKSLKEVILDFVELFPNSIDDAQKLINDISGKIDSE